MKYILETSKPLSESIMELIKETVPYAHVESIKPLIVDEEKLDKIAETYANKMQTDYGYDNDWVPLNEGFKAGYRKAKEG